MTWLVWALLQASPQPELVELSSVLPDAVVELKYATADNFMKRAVYPPSARCLVLKPLADALVKAAGELRPKGYRLKFYDCYRPHAVQYQMWEAYPHKGYVAEPKTGSHHNRAAAVDVTLIALDGTPVEMPTAYDSFSRAAFHSSTAGTPDAREHRATLRAALESAGLQRNPMEWWHYELPNAIKYPLRDDPF